MSDDDMTAAEKAYEAAQAEIARVKAEGGVALDLNEDAYRALAKLPPEIGDLTSLRYLYLNVTSITDLRPIARLTQLDTILAMGTNIHDLTPLNRMQNLEILLVQDTHIDDLSPLSELTNLNNLSLNRTPVTDLTPLLQLRRLVDDPAHDGLTFISCGAARTDPVINRISKVSDPADRARQLFDYLREQQKKQKGPTLEQVMDAQDRTGWRFSISDSAFELFVHNDDVTEQQKKMGAQTRERLQKLLEKLQFGNAFAIRADVLDEVQSFLALLDDETTAWSDNALGLWASLIALGGQLEANDQAMSIGRAELDCLKSEERAALQTFLAVGSNFVRSFPDTKDLDDAYTAYSRTKVPVERLISLINGAIDQKLLTSDSTALISDVANVAKGTGTQADKAHGVTVTGMTNLVTVAAITGTAVGSAFIAGGAGKVGSDVADHYELSAKATGFLDSMSEEIAELLNGLPPDEKANMLSYLRDRAEKKLEQ